jgi:hypothetical protein
MLVSLLACRRHYPGGTLGPSSFAGVEAGLATRRRRPSPLRRWVGFRINFFEAFSAFTSRYGLHARGAAYTALSVESFNRLVTRAAVSTATGCNDYLPGGTFTRWTPTPFSRRTTQLVSEP